MSLLSAPVHTTRRKCDKGNCADRVLFLLLQDTRQATLNCQEMTSKTTILPQRAAAPQGRSELRPPIQRFQSISEGSSHLRAVRVPSVVHNGQISLYRKFTSSSTSSFFLFFVFFAVTFQLLLSSKQVLLKDSH